jgi:hypothetical protein
MTRIGSSRSPKSQIFAWRRSSGCRALLLPVTLLFITLLIACGDDDASPTPPAGPLTVAEAVGFDGEATVVGFAIREGDVTQLCELMAESFPPQCGGAALVVEGWDITASPDAQTEGSVTWVEQVQLDGTLADGTLTVAE